jgi:hypothetical protein
MQGAKETTELPGSANRILWVLSRCFLRQKVFELAEGLPDSKRKTALSLMVRKWSPYVSTGFAAHWSGTRACVYAWDSAKVAAAITAAGLSPTRCTVWPETFIREPLQEGIRLAAMTDGYEGQVWRDDMPIATRWWPEPPPMQEWTMFLRAAGADLTRGLPEPVPVETPVLNGPWTVAVAPITDFWSLLQNDRAAAIAVAALALPFLYLFGQVAVLGVGSTRLSSEMSDLAQANQSIRMERNSAVNDLDAIQKYLSLEPFPPQFQLMATAEKLLRDKGVGILEWTYDSGNLELVIHADAPLDATAYIEAFEGSGMFHNVTATSENQEHDLRLRMQVTPTGAVAS